ncbi:MAG: glycosyltransferase [Candidatus Adiutrix sp.]|jgi:spore maturation protein CgeB|nr:glycosyltransferase [Candidatus Adiutrix sp.]
MALEKGLSRVELLARPVWAENKAALEAGGQTLALAWLLEGPIHSVVAEVEDQTGGSVLVVEGQSQASRHDPALEARRWLEKLRPPEAPESVMFGLGTPWPTRLFLEEFRPGRPLTVFEPDPLVALAVLSIHDFSRHLAAGNLRLLTPWHLAGERPRATGPLLVHPPAQRREPARFSNFQRALTGVGVDLGHLSGRPLRLMIIPPLSGGSWPVAVSLAVAAQAGPHQSLLLEWGADLRELERAAQSAPTVESALITTKLFESTAPLAARAAAEFKPDLILTLAQAPLEVKALEQLRLSCGALLAFWLVEDFRQFGYVAEVAPAYDALFHLQPGLIEPALRDWGISRSHYLPLAADPELFRPRDPAETQNYRADLSFMGAGYPNRRRLLGRLAEDYWPRTGRPADSFRIFGSGWAGAGSGLAAHLFEGGRRVEQPECALIYAGARVQLNIHSSGRAEPGFNPESRLVNPRTFEIAAAGGFQIVDFRPLLPPLFRTWEELAVAGSPEELPDLIERYLARPEEARAIGQAARARVLAEHTYSHRLRQLLADLGWQPSV